jgi:redox-sensitive bicupin YhaK (pirin superfamily)
MGNIAERLGEIVPGVPHKIGEGFIANHFSEEMFHGRMDPLLMVDHFVMTAPTFEPHLHAGISAVTMMFEDSVGSFLNRDTLGHNVSLKAGDLYWLAAASGAAHEEKPQDGARIHALQIFVNLPARLKSEPARALHIDAARVPVLEGCRHRVRVVLGRSGETVGTEDTPKEMTMLDGSLKKDGRFAHLLAEGQQAWLYALTGELTLRTPSETRILKASSATTIEAGRSMEIVIDSSEDSHFVLMAAKPIREAFVKYGPLVMSTAADVRQTLASYHAGKFGRIST